VLGGFKPKWLGLVVSTHLKNMKVNSIGIIIIVIVIIIIL
jgi:hypothetical protein